MSFISINIEIIVNVRRCKFECNEMCLGSYLRLKESRVVVYIKHMVLNQKLPLFVVLRTIASSAHSTHSHQLSDGVRSYDDVVVTFYSL